MSEPREKSDPAPMGAPDAAPEQRESSLDESLFTSGQSLTPDTTSHPSIKNK